jgi:23S rRNA pseudouridine1911/1915/1917 synthase
MHQGRGFEYGVHHVLAAQSGELSGVLRKQLDIENSELSQLLHLGAIYINEKRIQIDASVQAGDYLRVHRKPRRFYCPNELEKSILQETENYVVLNKPHGLPTHSTVDNTKENALHLLSEKLGQPLFVTHRLDVATSGILVLAKNKSFQKFFNDQLLSKQVQKYYRALVHGAYNRQGCLQHYMQPSPKAPKTLSDSKQQGWYLCSLDVLDCEQFPNRTTELKIKLITGRTHQIRSQLAFEGHPIVGDRLYGACATSNQSFESICLQAYLIEFQDIDEKIQRIRLTRWSPWEI